MGHVHDVPQISCSRHGEGFQKICEPRMLGGAVGNVEEYEDGQVLNKKRSSCMARSKCGLTVWRHWEGTSVHFLGVSPSA